MILHGATVKHKFLCSHEPTGKDGGSGKRTLCVHSGRCWGFKPGGKSCLSVNEPQNSRAALGFWRLQLVFLCSNLLGTTKIPLRGHVTRSPHHLLQWWRSQRAAAEEFVGVHNGCDLSGWSPGWAKGSKHQFTAPCVCQVCMDSHRGWLQPFQQLIFKLIIEGKTQTFKKYLHFICCLCSPCSDHTQSLSGPFFLSKPVSITAVKLLS